MFDIEWVRERVAKTKQDGSGNIRVHPNGFVQLDLLPTEEGGWHATHHTGHSGASLRLHVWNPADHDLPHQVTVNEIHDHVFDMKSTVVRGVLTQVLYGLLVGTKWPNTHEIYRAIYNKGADSRLETTGVQGVLKMQSRFPVSEGGGYTQRAFTLHDSQPYELGPVVTVMEKTKIYDGTPVVICPLGVEPDNSFDRASAAPADYLWSAVEASIA